MPKGPLIILSGPSGSGKSTVVARLLALGDLPLHLSVSATTRAPRPGEQDGVAYHFWTRERFLEDEASAQARLANARGELARAEEYDHQIVNDDLDAAVGRLHQIVADAF